MLKTGQHAIDSITAMAVALIIVYNAYRISSDSIHILLEGVPKGLNRDSIVHSIEALTGEKSVKDLHVWNLCSHLCALSVHLVLPESQMSRQKVILENVSNRLEEKFNIVHSTIQIESEEWQKGGSAYA